ncbi:MAG: isoprenylcysteine carboxylmethyltransferase family protein [Pseudomonadota bacterium]
MSADEPSKDAADVRVLPPVVFVAVLAIVIVLQALVPISAPLPAAPFRLAGLIAAALGLAVAAPAVAAFLTRGEQLPPDTPTKAIVETGPYRFTRNPMYLGMALLLLAFFFWTRTAWAGVGVVVFVWIIHTQVILKEEAYLKAKFGAAYEDYLSRVRRWI